MDGALAFDGSRRAAACKQFADFARLNRMYAPHCTVKVVVIRGAGIAMALTDSEIDRIQGGFVTANVVLTVERLFPHDRKTLFAAFTDPAEMSQWRGAVGTHVEPDTVTSELKVGGRHHHVKVKDDDPSDRNTTDAIFTEFHEPDVFVARQRITGAPGIDPNTILELRVEFLATGRGGTLVRIIQGPFDPSTVSDFSDGWDSELGKLNAYLAAKEVRQ
ncbi:MAG: SRPBCC domain-containing protein [Gordonia sp. (in: high G+C Gram-positive bacteria)]